MKLAPDINLYSNFNGSLLLDVMRYARIAPSVLQIEHHPYLVQQPLLNLANSLEIAVTAYCSFGPASWIELGVSQNIRSLRHDPYMIANADAPTRRIST
jgi:D-xylose reductase